uniref:Uncharacterized protein n=1 Tax=Anguilla anguilla TaxID=7936 RepID=A0A0E9T4D9_ANGAN
MVTSLPPIPPPPKAFTRNLLRYKSWSFGKIFLSKIVNM